MPEEFGGIGGIVRGIVLSEIFTPINFPVSYTFSDDWTGTANSNRAMAKTLRMVGIMHPVDSIHAQNVNFPHPHPSRSRV